MTTRRKERRDIVTRQRTLTDDERQSLLQIFVRLCGHMTDDERRLIWRVIDSVLGSSDPGGQAPHR